MVQGRDPLLESLTSVTKIARTVTRFNVPHCHQVASRRPFRSVAKTAIVYQNNHMHTRPLTYIRRSINTSDDPCSVHLHCRYHSRSTLLRTNTSIIQTHSILFSGFVARRRSFGLKRVTQVMRTNEWGQTSSRIKLVLELCL